MIDIDLNELLQSSEIGHWTAAHLPPADDLARQTRAVLDEHQRWNSPHTFRAFAWDGRTIDTPMLAVIDPAIDPPDYPDALDGVVARTLARNIRDGAAPIVAFALQVEAHAVHADGSLTRRQRKAFDRREAYRLPEAIEQAMVVTVDLAGRMWTAVKIRDAGEVIMGGPDDPDATISGPLCNMMLKYGLVIPVMYTAADRVQNAP